MTTQFTTYTPIVQDGFSMDIVHNQLYEQFISGAGSITISAGVASISTGTSLYDYTLKLYLQPSLLPQIRFPYL